MLRNQKFIGRSLRNVFIGSLVTAFLFSLIAPAQAIIISPVRLEITGDPGTTIHSEFIASNDEPSAKTFYTTFENFEAQGETGTPNFIPARDGLATWIDAPSEITLQPGEKRVIPFSITIPYGTDPGGNFAAIFLGTAPPQKQGDIQVSIGGKIGLLILLKVSGDVKEGGGLLEFYAGEKQNVFSSEPVNFYYRFQNSGGDRVKPTGTVKVRNTFGLTSATLTANPSEGNILPTSIRKFNVVWGTPLPESAKRTFWSEVGRQIGHFHLGRYTADLQLQYGEQSLSASKKIAFWIIPWQLLSLLALVIIILFLIFGIGIKRYNRWIIKRARLSARSR